LCYDGVIVLNEQSDLDEFDKYARLFGLIAVRAGEAIVSVQAKATCPDYKVDGSPVTAADIAGDDIIRRCLERNLPDIPVITEETYLSLPAIPAGRFILVDPLDGTKEFLQGKDEFTVNIALIDRGTAVAGAVYAPARHQLYIGGTNAYRLDVGTRDGTVSFSKMHSIAVRAVPQEGSRAVVSHSHLDVATKQWIERHAITNLQRFGSSLKFCAIAEGQADVYPRLASTMEWDTAAGHAVLLAAGGSVTDLDGHPLQYGKPDYRNGRFVAWGAPSGLQHEFSKH
jgi:3'(2'), 5'-bisphosphate nucleotidase